MMTDAQFTLKSCLMAMYGFPEDKAKEDTATKMVLRAYVAKPRPAPPAEQGEK